jgi:hypothetical protein
LTEAEVMRLAHLRDSAALLAAESAHELAAREHELRAYPTPAVARRKPPRASLDRDVDARACAIDGPGWPPPSESASRRAPSELT